MERNRSQSEIFSQNQNSMSNSVDPDETAHHEPVSSGSTLFAQVSRLVDKDERVNYICQIF